MTELSNEILMAYADGVLDTVAAEQVEIVLIEHPDYRQRVHIFRMTRDPVQRAFDEVMAEPAPEKAVAILAGTVPLRFDGFGLGALRALKRRGPQRLSEIAIGIAARMWRYARTHGRRRSARLPRQKQANARAQTTSRNLRRSLAPARGRQPLNQPRWTSVATKSARTVFRD